jgi:chemotaxis methyl-accepting protein methylase
MSAMPSAHLAQKAFAQMTQLRVVRKYLGRPFLKINGWIWDYIPTSLTSRGPIRDYGQRLHALVSSTANREQRTGTLFFRNRPELDLLIRLLEQKHHGANVDLTVLACSKGAEVYSFSYVIRTKRPDLLLRINASDISDEVLKFAEAGIYTLMSHNEHAALTDNSTKVSHVAIGTLRDQTLSIFERMSSLEIESLFDRDGSTLSIKPPFREGIVWCTGDAGDPGIIDTLGFQDIVVANRFLCHMTPKDAESCLRNLSQLVKPGGYLFVSGVDLGARTKVMKELGWSPVKDLIEEIHEGDTSLRNDWPLYYWGLEPLDRRRPDWEMRYASVFQRPKLS